MNHWLVRLPAPMNLFRRFCRRIELINICRVEYLLRQTQNLPEECRCRSSPSSPPDMMYYYFVISVYVKCRYRWNTKKIPRWTETIPAIKLSWEARLWVPALDRANHSYLGTLIHIKVLTHPDVLGGETLQWRVWVAHPFQVRHGTIAGLKYGD